MTAPRFPRFPHLIRAQDSFDPKAASRDLVRRCRRGELRRVRHGIYVTEHTFASEDRAGRYRFAVEAVALSSVKEPVFAFRTAAFLWGLPQAEAPHGAVYVLIKAVAGGRSGHGVIRRREDGRAYRTVRIRGLTVLGKVDTAIDCAKEFDFPWAVAVFDRVMHRSPLPGDPPAGRPATRRELEEAIAGIRSAAQRRRLVKVLEFSDGRAQLPGESLSRVAMHRFGFPPPLLQAEIRDGRGTLVGIVDFFWPEFGIIGEFDGAGKYQREEYLSGRSPADAVIAEKRREDALRALGFTVVRWMWDDIRFPNQLQHKLREAGLPSAERK